MLKRTTVARRKGGTGGGQRRIGGGAAAVCVFIVSAFVRLQWKTMRQLFSFKCKIIKLNALDKRPEEGAGGEGK